MKKNRIILIGIISGMLLSQSVCASEISVAPSTHTISLESIEARAKIKDVPAYIFQDNNYFMLRDLGKIVGCRVDWNEESRKTTVTIDRSLQDLTSLSSAKPAEHITENAQTIIANNHEYKGMKCLNIDGYNYFKLRDLVDIMGFSCHWDEGKKTVVITPDADRYTVNVSPDSISSRLGWENYHIIEEDVPYLPNSGDYSHIEKYMQENIDSDFKTENYIITENFNIAIPGSLLDLRLNVNGVPSIRFGYSIACINEKMTVMNSVGKMNPDFDLEKAGYPKLSDEEVKKMAVEADGFDYEVDEQRIMRYFDMDELVHKCQVETVYKDHSGAYFCINHMFTDN